MNQKQGATSQRREIRVLMQNRHNAFTQRGGDTVVMEKLINGLSAHGVKVTVDLEAQEDPKNYDLVHLINFALPELTRALAERAFHSGVPYVVTTLAEDIPRFHNQAVAVSGTLIEYVRRGQDKAWYAANRVNVGNIPPCGKFDNRWAAEHAAALFTNGAEESAAILRDYPAAQNIKEIRLGYQVGVAGNRDAFIKEYGLKDFVFCVGRLESRKNQLLLLKALEESDLTVVFAGGGFTYQPDYEQAVRSFKRRGQTVVLGKLTPEMLASAYCAAKVHVLPSWYELPGLVSLEAASYGCNVVAARAGTAPDYLGPDAFYCDPSQEESIQNAVVAAYYSPPRTGVKELVMTHTWEKTVEETSKEYQRITGIRPETETIVQTVDLGMFDMAGGTPEFQETLERGELAARNRDYTQAHELLERAYQMNPRSVRSLRARGAVYLAESNFEKARDFFEKALLIDRADPKTLSGLGMCEMNAKHPGVAFDYFMRALEIDSYQLVTILQLLECSYTLGRFEDLERALSRYLLKFPEDSEMQYCLAGCLFKLERYDEARSLAVRVLTINPQHLGSKELIDHISKKNGTSAEDNVRPAPWGVSPSIGAAEPAVSAVTTTPDQPSPSVSSMSSPAVVSVHDTRISELEQAKKDKKFEEIIVGIEELQKASDLGADDKLRLQLLRAEVAVLTNDLGTAEAMYKNLMVDNSGSSRVLCGMGAICAAQGNLGDAERYFTQALVHNPQYDVALSGLGLVAQWNNNDGGAWENYEKALTVNPENTRALLGVIEVGYRLKRYDRIEQAIKGYLDCHPVDLDFLYSLAGCYYAQGRLEEATEELKKITLFEPANPRALELRRVIDERRAGSASINAPL